MHTEPPLYLRLAAAYVRGRLKLAETEVEALLRIGREEGLRLHRFKRSTILPRVAKVLGILRGIGPADLLDIGSGRGVFLWPLLEAFPSLPVTALDRLEYRVAD